MCIYICVYMYIYIYIFRVNKIIKHGKQTRKGLSNQTCDTKCPKDFMRSHYENCINVLHYNN